MDGHKRERLPLAIICGVILTPIAYVLAYAPTMLLALEYDCTRSWKLFYAPLRWLLYHCQPLNELMKWYISFWSS